MNYSNNHQNLFEQLRKWRNEIAKDAGIEPFKVLHNSVLDEIAQKMPTTLDGLSGIKGMGTKRIKKYGQAILDIVNGSSQCVISQNEEEKVFSVSEYIDYVNTLITSRQEVYFDRIKFSLRSVFALFPDVQTVCVSFKDVEDDSTITHVFTVDTLKERFETIKKKFYPKNRR